MKKLIIPLAIILVLTFLLTACGKSSTTTTATSTTAKVTTTSAVPAGTTPTTTAPATTAANTPIKGGVLQYVYPYSPTSIPGWPNDNTNPQRIWTMWTVFEPLVKLKADATPIPWLATSWEFGAQKQYITFTLRKGVKFSDGTEFTSEAVKTEADLVIAGKQSNAANWDRWEVIDDYTVRLYLKTYTNDMWLSLSVINMCFFSPTAYKANGVDYMKTHPIGTGPFTFSSFEKDVSMKFVKNPNYWQPGKPYLDGITMLTVKEALTQQATMQSGTGDVLALQSGKILADMKKLGFTVTAAYGGTDLVLFDSANADSVWANVKVRQALEYSLDKKSMSDALGYTYTVQNNQMPPPNNPAFNKNLPSRDYNPTKAKALLAEAGYPNGLQAKMITIGSEAKDLSIQQYAKAAGIDLAIESVDNAKFWDYDMKGWKGVMSTGFAVGPIYPAWINSYFPPVGIFDYSTKVPDAILSQVTPTLKEVDTAKFKTMSDALIQAMYDDCTVLPIYSSAKGFILAPYVHDSGIFNYVDYSVWDPELTWLSPKK